MSKVKIAFLINDITMPGGLARVVKNLVEEFMQVDHEFEVVAISCAAKYDRIKHPKIEYLDMPILHGLSSVKKVLWYKKLKDKVEHSINSNNYRVVIAVGTAMSLFSSFCNYRDAKSWGAEHTAHNYCSFLRKCFKRWRYPKLEHLICLTHSDKERYYDRYLPNVTVIPNFTNFSNANVVYSNNPSFLFVGNYNHIKGIDYLLAIIKAVALSCPNWRFELFGEGKERGWVVKQLASLKLNSIVTVNPPTNDISKKYQKAGIFILTSRNEGFPMVLLEAQAHGIPVVSFDCETGPSEIITDGEDGYLIPPFDTQAFANRLVELANDGDLRESMSKHAFINRQRFDKSSIISLWLALFRKSL